MGFILPKPKAPPPVIIPQREDPGVQARAREERERQRRLRGRAALILSEQGKGEQGVGSQKLSLGGQ